MVTTILTIFSILLFAGVALGLMRIWWTREEMMFELEEAQIMAEMMEDET